MEQLQTKHKFIAFLLFLLTALSMYYMTFRFDYFFFDDHVTFQGNSAIYDIANLKEIFLTFKTRFIPGYTFALNYAIGGITHFWFRLTNISIHGANSFLVYLLALELFNLAVKRQQIKLPSIQLVAFFTGLLFLVHPVQTEPINLVVQRMTMMSTMFYILTSYLFIRFRITNLKRYYILAVLSCTSAMFCKENAFTLPFMIIIIDLLLFKELSGRKKYLQHIPFLLTLLIIPFLLSSTTNDMTHTARIASFENEKSASLVPSDKLTGKIDITRAGHTANISRYKYFLTEINVLRTYIRIFLLPIDQQFLRSYPISSSFSELRTIVSSGMLLFLIGIAVRMRKKHPVLTLAVFWYFVTLSIESSIIPIGHLIAEYRMYIAMFSLSFIFVYVIFANIRNFKLASFLVVCIIAVLAWTTSERNLKWEDEYTLWRDNYIKNPSDIRVAMSYAQMLGDRDEGERSLELYSKALDRIGCENVLCYNIFVTNLRLKHYSQSARILKRMKMELGETFGYYMAKGILSGTIGNIDSAIFYLRKASQKEGQGASQGYPLLCGAYEQKKDMHGALSCYGQAIAASEYDFNLYVRKAFILLTEDNREEYQDFLASIRRTKHADFADKIEAAFEKLGDLAK